MRASLTAMDHRMKQISLFFTGHTFQKITFPQTVSLSQSMMFSPEERTHNLTKPFLIMGKGKGKAIPLQTWTGPEDSRRLKLADFKTVGT